MRIKIFIIACFISFHSFGQRPNLIFSQINVDNGLSENTIRMITQDHFGFMWVGTEDGINRYNGYEFNVYRHSESDKYSLSDNFINYGFKDSKQRLWIATEKGLNLFDFYKTRFYNFKNDDYPVLKHIKGSVEDIKEDKEGNVWVAVEEKGIFKLSPDLSKYEYFSNKFVHSAIAIVPISDNEVYIGNEDGLYHLVNGEFHKIHSSDKPFKVYHMVRDKKNNIVIGTTEGMKVINLKSKKLVSYHPHRNNRNSLQGKEIQCIDIDKDNNYIIAVDGSGLDLFDTKKKIFHHYTTSNFAHLSSNNVVSVFVDQQNDIWAGTYMHGLNYANRNTQLFALQKSNPKSKYSLSEGSVASILQDSKDRLWIGTDGGGLNLYEEEEERFYHIVAGDTDSSLPSNKIIGIKEDKDGVLWLSTYGGGLVKFNPDLNTFKTYKPIEGDNTSIPSSRIRCTYEDKYGKIWLGTYGDGVSIMDKSTEKFKTIVHEYENESSLASNWVHNIKEDSKGRIWIGTNDGLCLYQRETNDFKVFKHNEGDESSISDNVVVEIFEDSKNRLWFGTAGGLSVLNENGQSFTSYRKGLCSNNIQSILEDDGLNLWVSTKRGVFKFNTFTKKITNFTYQDGMPSSAFYPGAKFNQNNDKLYFGANNGVVIIEPYNLKRNKNIPPIILTGIKVKNEWQNVNIKKSFIKQDIPFVKELVLPYSKNSIGFKFAALSYSNSKRNNYKYKLEGFDDYWIDNGHQRSAFYTKIPSGTYVFKVMGSNNHGVWNKVGASIIVVIETPFWATWWFRILVLSFIVLSVIGVFRYRIGSVKRANQRLEVIIAERTEEVLEQKEEIEKQKNEIQDNISVGKMIQDSILPPIVEIQETFSNSFVWYKPKDIVSGDFYWFYKTDKKTYIAAVDCTGHGVAGAFMSLIGYNILNDIVRNHKNPSADFVLNQLNEGVIKTLRQRDKDSRSREGMDLSLCVFDNQSNTVEFAGAMNNLYLVRNGSDTVEIITADKFSIGISRRGKVHTFTSKVFECNSGDLVYLFSDGFPDQLGGIEGQQKFLYPRFRELLVQISNKKIEEQYQIIDMTINEWKGDTEQTDDMLVVGIKV